MAKLFAKTKVLRRNPNTGKEELIQKGQVFDATPEEAKQLDKLGSARPATGPEIEAAKEAAALADGSAYQPVVTTSDTVADPAVPPSSGAEGDPKNAPKSKVG